MTVRSLVLADPALLARTTFGWGTAGSFVDNFIADNVEWPGEVVPDPDFDAAESTYVDNFDVPPWGA